MRVVVEFEDDQVAKDFVSDIVKGYQGPSIKVTAAYKKPTKFCDPSDGHQKGKGTRSFTRGRKYGWWVCSVCGKPTKRWATGDIWHFSMGYNLLPPSVSELERGIRSSVEWTEEDLGIRREPDPLLSGGVSGDVQEPRVGEDPSA